MIQDLKNRPVWLKKKFIDNCTVQEIKQIIKEESLNTVCISALCPNQSDCFSRRHLTFLLLGNVCTRGCSFCGIRKESPALPDEEEPERVARAVKKLGLCHCIVTSVTRDDLPDGGAGYFAKTISLIRHYLPKTTIEILVPDFAGDSKAADIVISARPDIFAHNIETIPRLYPCLRPQAEYKRSLRLISHAVTAGLLVKSGLMVGLGEGFTEVLDLMEDLRRCGCQVLTIGQYLRPTPINAPVVEYVEPQVFNEYEIYAKVLGFKYVMCGPFVRSSSMVITH